MLAIQLDHPLRCQRQVGPPTFQGDVRRHEKLAVFVNGSFGYPDDPLELIGDAVGLLALCNDLLKASLCRNKHN